LFDTTKQMLYITRKVFNNGNIKVSCKKNFKKLKNSEILVKQEQKYYNLSKEERINLETGEIEKRLHSLSSAYDSAHRAKNTLLDIIQSNDFEYFVALTFDNKIVGERLIDRITRKIFRKWCESVRKKFPYMTYAAVPEYHEKGGLHFHMLIGKEQIYDSDSEEVKFAKRNFNLSSALKLVDSGNVCASFTSIGNCKREYFNKVKNNFELSITDGLPIFNITAWDYGFSTASQVLNKEAVKYYLTDYITKGHIDERFFSKKRFFCSHNILRPYIDKQSVLLLDSNSSANHINIEKQYGSKKIEEILVEENITTSVEDFEEEFKSEEKQYTVFNNDKEKVVEIKKNREIEKQKEIERNMPQLELITDKQTLIELNDIFS